MYEGRHSGVVEGKRGWCSPWKQGRGVYREQEWGAESAGSGEGPELHPSERPVVTASPSPLPLC